MADIETGEDGIMAAPPFYEAASVARLLDYDGCIAAMRAVMRAFSDSGIEQPLRTIIPLGPGQVFAQMPGHLAGLGFGAKILSVFGDPAHSGRAAHRGVVILFDAVTGAIACIADAGAITDIRTAAASAMATDVLARSDARRLAIFGCGAQARSHVHALSRVRDFDRIDIWGRNLDAAVALAAALARATGLDVRGTSDARAVAEAADVICTVTASPTPILHGDWVRPGTHVNVVGSSYAGPVEIDGALVLKSRFVADSRRSVLAAGAEFLAAKAAGIIDDAHIVGEIGEILSSKVVGRTGRDDITLYKSLGHVLQDLAAVAYVHAGFVGSNSPMSGSERVTPADVSPTQAS